MRHLIKNELIPIIGGLLAFLIFPIAGMMIWGNDFVYYGKLFATDLLLILFLILIDKLTDAKP